MKKKRYWRSNQGRNPAKEETIYQVLKMAFLVTVIGLIINFFLHG